MQMLLLFILGALLGTVASVKGSETPLDEKETFVTLNSMYTNDLVWSDELAEKALDWLKSPEHRNRIKADLVVGGRGLVADAKDKLVWQKILDVLEIHFDEKEAESTYWLVVSAEVFIYKRVCSTDVDGIRGSWSSEEPILSRNLDQSCGDGNTLHYPPYLNAAKTLGRMT